MTSLYKTIKGKEKIIELYDQKLNELKISTQSKFVDTLFGKTHILIAGDSSLPPLVVIHGSNGCAPVALETYKDLIGKFCIYAVDVLAQPNKSAETRLNMKDLSYGKWLNEILKILDLKNVTLAGFSFGGLIILKTLLEDQSRIKEVILTAPAFIYNGNPIKSLFKFFIPMKRYMTTKKEKYLMRFVNNAFTDDDQFALKFLGTVFKNFEMDFTPIPLISKPEANRITIPITIFAAKNDIIFPGEKLIKRAKAIFPSLQYSYLLRNSKHVQNEEDNSLISRYILNRLPIQSSKE
jgi:pimeloyl-ACP methyl ester carboxylesterase